MRVLGVMLVAAVALAGCGKSGGGGAADTTAAPASAPTVELTAADKQALVAAMPAPYATADLANGEAKFAMCQSCHTISKGGPNMTGPNLHGIFGRKVGTDAGFTYSDPVKAAGFTWDEAHLDTWLTDPKADIPGTKMTFPGLKDPKDRIDVIAYLKAETSDKPAT